uniref:Uncharacterized protein n=1 Tax=Dulem virus 42 TaxID=3145760 RepID=A0AAU8BBU9_9CAUD
MIYDWVILLLILIFITAYAVIRWVKTRNVINYLVKNIDAYDEALDTICKKHPAENWLIDCYLFHYLRESRNEFDNAKTLKKKRICYIRYTSYYFHILEDYKRYMAATHKNQTN